MKNIKVYKTREGYAQVSPLNAKRSWMDETYESHAYKCFPVGLTNQLGWGISFPEDITFIWDGICDSTPNHVKVLAGEKYVYTSRANATISFNTGLMFVTEKNQTLLSMPVPNQFIDGVVPFTTLLSTSFFRGDLPVAWRITRPNVEITIKANTPIISIMPIDLEDMQNSEMILSPIGEISRPEFLEESYSAAVMAANAEGRWTNFYRDATDHKGKKMGEHQVKAIRLKGGSK